MYSMTSSSDPSSSAESTCVAPSQFPPLLTLVTEGPQESSQSLTKIRGLQLPAESQSNGAVPMARPVRTMNSVIVTSWTPCSTPRHPQEMAARAARPQSLFHVWGRQRHEHLGEKGADKTKSDPSDPHVSCVVVSPYPIVVHTAKDHWEAQESIVVL